MKGLHFTYQLTLCNLLREHILCLDRLCEGLVSGVAVCLVVLFQLTLSSCSSDDSADVPKPTNKEIVHTVAVVAPIGDASTKSRLERTAQWFAENHREAQQGDSVVTRFQLEWYDELSEDLTTLSTQLAKSEDVVAVIGPFGNDAVDAFAPACMKKHKALIAPIATSEEVLRRYAVASRTDIFLDNHFFWPLTETDVRFTETLMSETVSNVPSWHHQAVLSVEGTSLKVTAVTKTSGIDIIEAVERTDKPFFIGLQYHPEVAVAKHANGAADASRFMDYDNALCYFRALVKQGWQKHQ